MEPIPAVAERSMRKSRNRQRTLFALASVREAYLGELSAMTGIERNRMRGVLVGHMPYYSVELSLVGCGLAEAAPDARGTTFRLTTRGLRKARSLAKRRRTAHCVGSTK